MRLAIVGAQSPPWFSVISPDFRDVAKKNPMIVALEQKCFTIGTLLERVFIATTTQIHGVLKSFGDSFGEDFVVVHAHQPMCCIDLGDYLEDGGSYAHGHFWLSSFGLCLLNHRIHLLKHNF